MKCPQCQGEFTANASRANRAARIGAPLYCGMACAGLARRRKVPLTEAARKEAKRIYDAERRAKKGDEIRAQKREHYYANHERILSEMTAYRAKHMQRHIGYCRTPEYKAWKADYDKRRKYAAYGPFADAAMLLDEIEREIRARATRYEIYIANGRFKRSAQQRRRELWQTIRSNRT